jgi:predicted alpha-1,2-mannosidase
MRPRDEAGRWVGSFDPFAWGGPYAEGGPWQSSWFVPHDPAGLAGLLGGRERLAEKLDQLLGTPPVFHFGGYGHVIHEMTEMGNAKFGQYAQSNQPSFHLLYLYAAAGQPWKTQYWTRRVCAEMFDSTPRGFPGDEDNGSMASWYLLSSIGLYSLCPGTPEYVLGSPLFSRVTLHESQGKPFVIEASPQGDGNSYVQRRELNGALYTRTWISHSDVIRGGELRLDMGPEPDTRPVAVADLPYSASPP